MTPQEIAARVADAMAFLANAGMREHADAVATALATAGGRNDQLTKWERARQRNLEIRGGHPALEITRVEETSDLIGDERLADRVDRLEAEREQARAATRALVVFCRQAGCTDQEIGAILEAHSPAKFPTLPEWLHEAGPKAAA